MRLHLVSKEFWALGVFWIGTAKLFYKGENKCMLVSFSCRQFFLLTTLTYEVWTGSVRRKHFEVFWICTASEVMRLPLTLQIKLKSYTVGLCIVLPGPVHC